MRVARLESVVARTSSGAPVVGTGVFNRRGCRNPGGESGTAPLFFVGVRHNGVAEVAFSGGGVRG